MSSPIRPASSLPCRRSAPLALRFAARLALLLTSVQLFACGSPPDDADELAASPHALSSCRGAPYPIVLAHGFAGFERIGPLNYFFMVAADLRSRGETVIEAQVPPFDSSAVRATYLATVIDDTLRATGACKVNLIGHSQGGIDARALVSQLGYGDRVAGLITVASPHRGTPVADAALGLIPGISYDLINAILRALWSLASAPGDAKVQASLRQLSTDYMTREFNPKNPDDRRVKYYSVAGRSSGRIANSECAGGAWGNSDRIDLLDPLLTVAIPAFALTSPNPLSPVPNDGLVSVASSRWGNFLGCVPADHLDEVGQIGHLLPDLISGFDHRDLYRRLARTLHSDGF
ncbi:MAG TPA: triacylglycerol lipase [Pseudomonadota bacterium]|nr:triacylglycerol lipase [Pseudomonadota bacterium]